MAVITVSRQLESWGTEIAQEVANRLKYDYADKKRIGALLGDFGFPEPEMEKFDEKKPPFWDSFSLERRKFLHSTQAVIYDLASKGKVVVVGRGGQVLLRNVPGILHVRIISPFEVRVKRLVEKGEMDEKHAARILRQSDQDSSGFIQTFFNVNWDDPNLYDLFLNTKNLSQETAVKVLVDSVQSPEIRKGEEQAQEKLADLALGRKAEAKLLDVLGLDIRHVEVEAGKGIVTLKGSVISIRSKENCERVISGMEGVTTVENYLTVSPYYRYGP
jgi:cytidylate kinase